MELPATIAWRKSSFCSGGACVEVAFVDDEVMTRDSTVADSPVLRFTRTGWSAFAEAVRKDALVRG
jgi:hypothetical protein